MMVSAVNEVSSKVFRQIADEYREEGYRVCVYPSDKELPSFLRGMPVDLIADSRTQKVVVAVVPSERRTRAAAIVKLARLLEDRRGWRFDIVVPASRQSAQDEVERSSHRPLTSREAIDLLDETTALLRSRQEYAAHIVACSAVEALGRDLVIGAGIKTDGESPTQILKNLFAFGFVTRSDYYTIKRAFDQRNALVHGLRRTGQKGSITAALIKIARKPATESATSPAPFAGRAALSRPHAWRH